MGYTKAASGEFLIAAHVLTPVAALTHNFNQPDEGTSVVVYNECYRPSSKAPRRYERKWACGVRTLLRDIDRHYGTLTAVTEGGKPECMFVAYAQPRDLWEVTRTIEDRTGIPTRALHTPCKDLQELIEVRRELRHELYTVGGNIRETRSFQRAFQEQLETITVTASFDTADAYSAWRRFRRYFPVHESLRVDMEEAFSIGDKEIILELAKQIAITPAGRAPQAVPRTTL